MLWRGRALALCIDRLQYAKDWQYTHTTCSMAQVLQHTVCEPTFETGLYAMLSKMLAQGTAHCGKAVLTCAFEESKGWKSPSTSKHNAAMPAAN